MRISIIAAWAALACGTSGCALAPARPHGGHKAGITRAFRLEADAGAGRRDAVQTWELNGGIGGDTHKLRLKSEGERIGDKIEAAEFWAAYSRNVSAFWDAQLGVRYDGTPRGAAYAVAGFEGLAPYFFETEAHVFLRYDGKASARLRQENDIALTQKIIAQPYVETNFYAQDVPEYEIGAGLAGGEIGIQTRYMLTRKFAPYIDMRYERAFGETASAAKRRGEDTDDIIAALGARVMF